MQFLWIAAYGLVHMLSVRLSHAFSLSRWVTPLAMLGYAGALILWLFRTGQHRSLGLCALRKAAPGEYAQLLPLLLLPGCHLLTAPAVFPQLPTVVLMLGVCAAEEIFFRGFLLHFLEKHGAVTAVLLSSGIFALFHCVNLIGGSGLSYTLMQVLCACAAGICYGAVTIRFRSLIPAFLSHFLTNITASGGQSPWLWGCIALLGCCGVSLCRKIVSK